MTSITRNIMVNGQTEQTTAPHLQALLLRRGLSLQSAFACAVNNQFVPRPRWTETSLAEGDRIDIIAPITGG